MFLYDRDSLSILEAPKSIELENIPLFDGKNGRPGEAVPMKTFYIINAEFRVSENSIKSSISNACNAAGSSDATSSKRANRDRLPQATILNYLRQTRHRMRDCLGKSRDVW